ncbi:tyrosine-type recombinase/integrase [Rhodoferax sp.]|uniref:tyrosine-type recombinase/integrase n=1 Tax=Rhodoferax sp. TaxID=50421 RepID=UPI002736D754|nr:tyrosine-type recombinase/integrase [Rhodoferax sp.]MDP3192613.1 tyrosine-type recombinase/integrase [Rhodoferax sp.]MDP3335222.1 tyrosine-type recombinase/integrase [Rhodoferax sp.]
MKLKHAHRRDPKDPDSSIIYQRGVPSDLRDRYPGKMHKHDLKTSDITKAAPMVEALNRRYEAEWAGLRAAPESSPQALKVHATALLSEYGLAPGDANAPAADQFFDRLENKLHQYAGTDQDRYDNATPADYLTSVEQAAFKALQGKQLPTLTDALELHLSIHPQRDDTKFTTYQRRAFATLTAVTGDKNMADFKRTDARAYLDASLLTTKTTTVRRRLGVMSAVFATYIRENDLPTPNPFASLQIVREGHDATKRIPFTKSEIATLEAACRAKDDPMRWILAMLAGTGARLAEIVGLTMEDINLDREYPHVILQVHPWRDIKGANGIRGVKDRTVPLAGVALWAAQRIKATAVTGQSFAFPQYTTSTECKATSASGALNAWLKRLLPLAHTCHELRHTLKDLLRAVQCPKDISDAITGHGTKSVGDGYGTGYDLRVKSEWLTKALHQS